MKYRLIIALFYVVIFFTGAAGLIYQVTWQRYLSRLLGSDSIATAIILAVFLGGLSTGYFLCGKISLKIKNQFKAYALMEGIIGAWCLFFPQLFHFTNNITRSWSFAPPFWIIVQGFICSAFLMAIPTICMGSTIPFLTRGIAKSITEATRTHARVYAINTAGAFIGTLLAGFYLVPELGLPVTILTTAFLNLGACLIVYVAQNFLPTDSSIPEHTESKPETVSVSEVPASNFTPMLLYVIAFLSGFYVMTLENVLIRITNLSLGSSSYSFSLIIAVFILSIAVGSYFIANRKNLTRRTLYYNQLGITLSLLVLYVTLDLWPYGAHLLRVAFQSNIFGFWAYYAAVFIAILALLLVPVGLMGATVPLTFHEIKRKLRDVGKHSGYLFSYNTIGSLCGSLIGGIVFYHFFDNPAIFLLAILFAGISTILCSRHLPKRFSYFAMAITIPLVLLVLSPPLYEKTRFAVGTFRMRGPTTFTGTGPSEFFKQLMAGDKKEVLYYKDGTAATVAVVENLVNYNDKRIKGRSVFVNGKSDSNTIGDAKTLKLSAHLPGIFSPNKKSVLVVGLGTGVTAGEFTLYPELDRIDVAEISPSVVEALPYFADFNQNLHKNPRVRIHVTDAFRFLGRTSNQYDIITSEPSNPWVTGIDQLFTEEFYTLVKEHLKPNGIFVQWIHAYASDISMVGMVFNTVQSNFESCHVFKASHGDLLIMASMDHIDNGQVQKAKENFLQNQSVRKSLAEIDINNFDALLIRELLETAYLAKAFKGFGIQTLDNPRLHYIAGKCFFKGSYLPDSVIYNAQTAVYYQNYFLAKQYEPWINFYFSDLDQAALLESVLVKDDWPYADALKLKQIVDNEKKRPELNSDQLKALDLLALTTEYSNQNDENGFDANEMSYREKATDLLNFKNKYRNWIFPFPIKGLEAFLSEGITMAEDAQEKNWCAAQLIILQLDEYENRNEAERIFRSMVKNDNGIIIADASIQVLLENIKKRLL